ncbi:hypothetical protein [Ruminococcus sp.]|uniref:hypothetical protein n=1 Tax=Ruminococcus sp. TaxID=41978 RepID=UPI0025F4FB50|nr:hypothetical protein [Ruminococcus sp.]
MKLDNIIDFFTSASKSDLIFNIVLLFIALLVISGNLYVMFNIKKWLARLENEIKTANRHLAHLDPNPYNDQEEN